MTSKRALDAQAVYEATLAVRRQLAERNAHMRELRQKHGWTLEAIGKIYGVTRQRVNQILSDPESHILRPPPIPRLPRPYTKHNGKIPHGTATGYTYGCRTECPASPTCTEKRREYQREWYKRKAKR